MLAALKLIANDRRTNGSHQFLVCIVQLQAVPPGAVRPAPQDVGVRKS